MAAWAAPAVFLLTGPYYAPPPSQLPHPPAFPAGQVMPVSAGCWQQPVHPKPNCYYCTRPIMAANVIGSCLLVGTDPGTVTGLGSCVAAGRGAAVGECDRRLTMSRWFKRSLTAACAQESDVVRPLVYNFCSQPRNIAVFPKVLQCALRSGAFKCPSIPTWIKMSGLTHLPCRRSMPLLTTGGAISSSLAKSYGLSGNALATSKVPTLDGEASVAPGSAHCAPHVSLQAGHRQRRVRGCLCQVRCPSCVHRRAGTGCAMAFRSYLPACLLAYRTVALSSRARQ